MNFTLIDQLVLTFSCGLINNNISERSLPKKKLSNKDLINPMQIFMWPNKKYFTKISSQATFEDQWNQQKSSQMHINIEGEKCEINEFGFYDVKEKCNHAFHIVGLIRDLKKIQRCNLTLCNIESEMK